MAKFERAPGFPVRIERVRVRLGFDDETAFAAMFGIKQPSYAGWRKGAGTAAITLKRGLRALGIPDVDRTLSWLADGEGPEPHWLAGAHGSPLPPHGPDGMVAMPQRVLDVGREAFKVLDGARAVGELRDPTALRVWSLLEREESFTACGSRRTPWSPSKHAA